MIRKAPLFHPLYGMKEKEDAHRVPFNPYPVEHTLWMSGFGYNLNRHLNLISNSLSPPRPLPSKERGKLVPHSFHSGDLP